MLGIRRSNWGKKQVAFLLKSGFRRGGWWMRKPNLSIPLKTAHDRFLTSQPWMADASGTSFLKKHLAFCHEMSKVDTTLRLEAKLLIFLD
jgi:hypothetical protein